MNYLVQENNTMTWPGLAYSAGVLLGQANVKNLAIIYSNAMFDLEIEAVVGRGEGKGKRVADLLNGSPVCLPFCTL